MTLPRADLVLSAYRAERWLDAQIESVAEQTHRDWRLWIRDDGSSDGTAVIAERWAQRDARIRFLGSGENLGAARGFGRVLEALPHDASYVFCCDADDVWRPWKMRRSLEAMLAEEEREDGPVLVHTDLTVTDAELRVLHPSYWRYVGIEPDRSSFRRIVVANVATGPTFLLNRPLLDAVREGQGETIPAAAPHQDWWIALVASAFGRLVALPEATVLYRRHADNATGRLPGAADALRRLGSAGERSEAVRAHVDATARQAAAFRDRYAARLSPDAVDLLDELATLPTATPLARKLRVLRRFTLPERGVLRNLGFVLRS